MTPVTPGETDVTAALSRGSAPHGGEERGGQLGGLLAPLFSKSPWHHGPVSDVLPFPTSQCHRCRHKRDVKTERSHFLRCVVVPSKYPPQPVAGCPLFEPLETEGA